MDQLTYILISEKGFVELCFSQTWLFPRLSLFAVDSCQRTSSVQSISNVLKGEERNLGSWFKEVRISCSKSSGPKMHSEVLLWDELEKGMEERLR